MPDSTSTAWGRIGAHMKWANTTNRTTATAPARAAFDAKFLAQADGDPVRAASLRKAYFARLALKSAQARRNSREQANRAKVDEIDAAAEPIPTGGEVA